MIKETKNLKLTLEADFSVSDSRTKYFESLDIISPTLPRLQSSPFRPYRNTCLVACHTAVAPVVRRECDGNFLNIPSVFLSFFLSFSVRHDVVLFPPCLFSVSAHTRRRVQTSEDGNWRVGLRFYLRRSLQV